MDPPSSKEGPDGSSIRPVSSLLAKFENLNRPGDATSTPSTRSVSPAPKPDRLRDSSPANTNDAPVLPRTRPQPKEKPNASSLQVPGRGTASGATSPSSPNRPFLPPPISPRPIRPPSFMVESPSSPPTKRGVDVPVGEQPSFLHTDSMVKNTSPIVGSRPFKIPSRPHTPTFDLGKSPRLGTSQPPSPPPPRRSAELRRERDGREGRATPPPVNRFEKPGINSRASYIADSIQAQDWRARYGDKGRSPPNGPSSSTSSLDPEDAPPMLPARPRPSPEPNVPARTSTTPLGFEPPPVHHAVVNMRRGREETNGGGARGAPSTSEPRPALPARPMSMMVESSQRSGTPAALPPPRPPRPGVTIPAQDVPAGKRTVSTPSTQMGPPPARPLSRSMTVDRGSTRVGSEYRQPQGQNGFADTRTADQAPAAQARSESVPAQTAYPDTSDTNRSKPYIQKGVHEIATKYDSRILDVCGELVCTSGILTRAWSLLDGEMLMSLSMSEGMKGTAVVFKPGVNVNEEGRRIWIGTNFGELMEADIATQSIVSSRAGAHGRHEIIKIHRHFNELWSLDEVGTLNVWVPDEDGTPNLGLPPIQSFRVPRGHTFSIVAGDELWHATGKEIRVFLPSADVQSQFQLLLRPLVQENAGEVTAGTLLPSHPDRIMFGHGDGKVSIYSRKDYSCLSVLNINSYKVNTLQAVGPYIWAGYNSGKISVYDTAQTPWAVKKDWVAHDNPVIKLIADRSSFYKLDRSQVVSLGADNTVRAWDGLLTDDHLEADMKKQEKNYCDFEKIKALVMTWNAGASTPSTLRSSDEDAVFIKDLLQSSDSPDILVFGFQELVDLEDKTATAKRFLKPKKKEGSDQERMSHQYRDWRDFLLRCLDDHMAGNLYQLLHSAPLVGLFTCIFVKADLRDRISNLSSAEIKRGMGGLHGNKGAIIVRFMVDDTSLCFVNCHLAAGQSQANSRHNDVAAILDASALPSERDPQVRIDSYVGGGDGTMVMDHELCVLNGDLNYRIDTMSRDTVVMAVKAGNLTKLLERDQLLVARRRNPAFRLRAFQELPLTFAPTYKYDVGTDNYDSSEKKRSPAWCDRLLYRGKDRIQQLDYRRHEVRVSDHRPVSGRFRFFVKRVRPKERAMAWMECQQRWEDARAKEANDEKLYYLTNVIGYDKATSQQLIRDYASRRDHRSPSRHRP